MTLDPKSLPNRLSTIDESNRRDHRLLQPEDRCAYFGEYTARKGATHSDTNQFIFNFKKGLSRRGKRDWPFKQAAIDGASEALAAAVKGVLSGKLAFVPVPPSKMRNDPMYDDRVFRMLTGFADLVNVEHGVRPLVCEVVRQIRTIQPMHLSGSGRNIADLLDVYEIDDRELRKIGVIRKFVICDDMLTTGCHYKAMVAKIAERVPDAEFWGIFLARRVPESHNVEEL